MKLLDKTLLSLFTLIVIVINHSCVKGQSINNKVKTYLEEEISGMEIFELSFAKPELLYLIQTDSLFLSKFELKIKNRFNSKLDSSYLTMNLIQFKALKNEIIKKQRFKNEYGEGYNYFLNLMLPEIDAKEGNSYADFIIRSLNYPEDIDFIMIYTLIYRNNKKNWNDILNNEVALWSFNNWVEYGFYEFRYTDKDTGKKIINDRIIEHIIKSNPDPRNSLIKKAVTMLKSFQ